MKQLIMFLIVNNVSVPNMTYLASFSLNISNEKTQTGLLVKAPGGWFYVENHGVAPRSSQPFILPRLIKWVPGIFWN